VSLIPFTDKIKAESPLKVGFLGAGYIADWHRSALRTIPQARLVAVCDQSAARGAQFGQRYAIPSVHRRLDAMLAEQRLDVVHVLLPPGQHIASARSLVDAGVHVLLEKPMGLDGNECAALARHALERGRAVGVSHNFLFFPIYQKLKDDIAQGNLGRLDQITITWNKELPQIRAGPFGSWLLRAPGNVMLDTGVHSVAHLLDLAGTPEVLEAEADLPIVLPSGVRFYRRWLVRAKKGATAVDLRYAFGGGFTEHAIHVRGSVGSATVDFDRNTYTLRRHRRFLDDLDRYHLTRDEANALSRQARRNLVRYCISKFGFSNEGNAFGASIARAMTCFYGELPRISHPGLAPDFAQTVVQTCNQICRIANAEISLEDAPQKPRPRRSISPDVLVLGGTGFIGQALVRRLANQGRPLRLLVRDELRLPSAFRELPLEIVQGDIARPENLDQAMRGIRYVYHLARAYMKTWPEWLEHEVAPTRAVAEASLRAKVDRLFYLGTTDAYYAGAHARTIDEQTPLDPLIHRRNLYARAKAESERLLTQLQREQGLPLVIFRPGVVLGSGASPFHWGVGYWGWESRCRLWGQGDNPLPIVLVDDVADALAKAVDAKGIVGESFNLVAEPCLSARDYVRELERATGARIDVLPTAAWKFQAFEVFKWIVKCVVRHPGRERPSYRDWETRSLKARFDCSKAKKILGWSPEGDRERIIHRGVVEPALEWFYLTDAPHSQRDLSARKRDS
jgi:predicted dehydrogenase/nucleoside-diphosphate-sugar epimerase